MAIDNSSNLVFEFVTGRGNCYNEVHVHIKRFLPSEISNDPNELKTWLHNRFVQKDELMETFYETGEFPSPVETPTRLGSTCRNLSSFLLLNTAVLAAIFVPSVRRLYSLTILGSPLLLVWIRSRGFI